MADYHDPWKQINYLRQALSQDKLSIGLLLGAGCPVAVKKAEAGNDPLIPDIRGMTDIVKQELSSKPVVAPSFAKISRHLISLLGSDYTVEDLLGHVRPLKEIGGMNGMTINNLNNVEIEICKSISGLANQQLPSKDTPYHYLADWI